MQANTSNVDDATTFPAVVWHAAYTGRIYYRAILDDKLWTTRNVRLAGILRNPLQGRRACEAMQERGYDNLYATKIASPRKMPL